MEIIRRGNMEKKFQGNIVLVVVLVLFCWPAALIYFLMNYKEA